MTHALRDAYVFVLVLVLAYSRHQFAKLVFNQKIDTWLALHVEAFEFFGSVIAVMVPDNLKAAAIRAAFDVRTEPVLNRSYRELARHYGFQVDPTPPYNPEKKGKVESAVGYVKHNFMATIAEERDIDVLNLSSPAGCSRSSSRSRRSRCSRCPVPTPRAQLQDLVGLKDLETTARYLHVRERQAHAAIQKLEQRNAAGCSEQPRDPQEHIRST